MFTRYFANSLKTGLSMKTVSRSISFVSTNQSNALINFRTRMAPMTPTTLSNPLAVPNPILLPSIQDILEQKRWKARGNTYQPSTLKRKRVNGFLARLRTKGGKKVLARRKTKGRWYLSH